MKAKARSCWSFPWLISPKTLQIWQTIRKHLIHYWARWSH
ncbi:hypothetical protein [Pseudomonas serboccidentalis]